MEKEAKKLLLVAVSVGIFLIIIIGAAILIMTPKAQKDNIVFSSSRPIPAGRMPSGNADPSEMLKNTDSIMGIQPPPVTEVQETDTSIDNVSRDGYRPAVSMPKPIITMVPDASEPAVSPASKSTAAPASPAEKPAVQAASKPTAKPAATVKPSTSSVNTSPAKITTPASKTTAPASKTSAPTVKPVAAAAKSSVSVSSKPRNDYWVQTGAFTAIVRAEDAKETLASKGLTSIIENRQVDGRTWYRVRLGPYTSENEAKYWLALVQSIDGFAGSQVRQTPSVQ